MGNKNIKNSVPAYTESHKTELEDSQFKKHPPPVFSIADIPPISDSISFEIVDLFIAESFISENNKQKMRKKKFLNSNFCFDPVERCFLSHSSIIWELNMTRLHALAELIGLQKRVLFREGINFDKFLEENQSGNTPFHLVFLRVSDLNLIMKCIDDILFKAKEKNKLFIRNRRGENFIHLLIRNKRLNISSKITLLEEIKKNINQTEWEIILNTPTKENELVFCFALNEIRKKKNNHYENSIFFKYIGILIPKLGFKKIIQTKAEKIKISLELLMESVVLGEPYWNYKNIDLDQASILCDQLEIYNNNPIKAIVLTRNIQIIEEYINKDIFYFDIFLYNFGVETQNISLFYEFLLDNSVIDPSVLYKIEIKTITSISKILKIVSLLDRKNENFLKILKNFRNFIITLFCRLQNIQISNMTYKQKMSYNFNELKAQTISFKLIGLLYISLELEASGFMYNSIGNSITYSYFDQSSGLSYFSLEPYKKIIRNLHFQLFNTFENNFANEIYKVKDRTKIFRRFFACLLEKASFQMSEKKLLVFIADSIIWSMDKFWFRAKFFKKILRKFMKIIVVEPFIFEEILDETLIFYKKHRKEKKFSSLKVTPFFYLRKCLDFHKLGLSEFGIENIVTQINLYEALKMKNILFLEILKKVDRIQKENAIYAIKVKLNSSDDSYEISDYLIKNDNSSKKTKKNNEKSKGRVHYDANEEKYYKISKKNHHELEIGREKKGYKIVLKNGKLLFKYTLVPSFFSLLSSLLQFSLPKSINSVDLIEYCLKNKFFSILTAKYNIEKQFKTRFLFGKTVQETSALWSKGFGLNLNELSKKLAQIEGKDILNQSISDLHLFDNLNNFLDFSIGSKMLSSPAIFIQLTEKNYYKTLNFLIKSLVLIGKSSLIQEIISKKCSNGLNIAENNILSGNFSLFLEIKSLINFEKIEISYFSINNSDKNVVWGIRDQINIFFLFCLFWEISDLKKIESKYRELMGFLPKNLLVCIFSEILLGCSRFKKHQNLIEKDLKNILEKKNDFSWQNVTKILDFNLIVNKNRMKYASTDKRTFFDQSLRAFIYKIRKIIMEKIIKIENKEVKFNEEIEKNENFKTLKNGINCNIDWVSGDFSKFSFFERILLIVDSLYFDDLYCKYMEYSDKNYNYFKLILEKDLKIEKEWIGIPYKLIKINNDFNIIRGLYE